MTDMDQRPQRFHAPRPVQLHEDEVDALAFLRIVRRRLPLIVGITLALTLASLPWILPLQRSYYAESRLLIRTPLATAITGTEVGNPLALDLSTETARLLTQAIAVRLIGELDLLENPEFNPTLETPPLSARILAAVRSRLAPGPDTALAPSADPMDVALQIFMNSLTVQRLGDVVVVGFVSHDPALAAAVPNAMVQTYLDEREQMSRQRVGDAATWLDSRISEQEARVARAQSAVTELRDREAPSSEDLPGDAGKEIAALTARRAALDARISDLRASLAVLDAATTPAAAAERIDSATMGGLQRELQIRRGALDALLKDYGDNHPDVAGARARIDETMAGIANEVDRARRSIGAEVSATETQVASLSESFAAAEEKLARARSVQTRIDELARGVTVEEAALGNLEQQRRSLETQGELPVADVEVLSPATPPMFPLGRGRSFYLLAAAAAAGSLALTAAFALELLDRRVRGFEQLAGIPGLTAAGLVPCLPKGCGSAVEAVREPRSLFTDSVHGLAMAIERLGENGPPSSLLVTSPLPGAGKSTLSLALSLVLQRRGQRTLLVDADLRHGSVHLSAHVDPEPGLADFLAGRAGLDDVIRRSEPLGIDVVPRGSQAVPVMNVRRMADLLERARRDGVIVLIDGPPALATTETLGLAEFAEHGLLVIPWGGTTRGEVELAVRRVQDLGLGDLLAAMNMVDIDRYRMYGFKDSGLFAKELLQYYSPMA